MVPANMMGHDGGDGACKHDGRLLPLSLLSLVLPVELESSPARPPKVCRGPDQAGQISSWRRQELTDSRPIKSLHGAVSANAHVHDLLHQVLFWQKFFPVEDPTPSLSFLQSSATFFLTSSA